MLANSYHLRFLIHKQATGLDLIHYKDSDVVLGSMKVLLTFMGVSIWQLQMYQQIQFIVLIFPHYSPVMLV